MNSRHEELASICHDMRQHVHALGLSLERFDKVNGTSDESSREALLRMHLSWQALDELLSRVLDVSRLNAIRVNLRVVEVAGLVRRAVLHHAAIAEAADVRVVEMVRNACRVIADESMLQRVLGNLLDNAIKFAPRGSSVVIASRRSRTGWNLQVRDAGPGMCASISGVGLGLAIAQRLVSLMNGRISVRSSAGRGCCMTIELPGATAAIDPSVTASEPDYDPVRR